jgi:hypothetical protein
VFPVRYELSSYILFRRKWLISLKLRILRSLVKQIFEVYSESQSVLNHVFLIRI